RILQSFCTSRIGRRGLCMILANPLRIGATPRGITQSSKPVSETPTVVEEPTQSTDEEETEVSEPVSTDTSSESAGSGNVIWLVLMGLLAASGAGLFLYDFRKISLAQKLSEQARVHVRKLNEKIALQPQLEKSAADLVQDIDHIMPLTSQDSKLFSHIVNDKNHPFIKPAKEIISGTQILKRMVSDLPKASAGNLKKTNVNRLIEEVSVQAYYSMRDHYPDFSCEMRRDLEKILPDTELNADEIRFVLFNILENAFESVWRKKSTSGKGYQPSVTITSRKLPRYIQVRVKDNGTGIPDNIRKDIFEPFFSDREGNRHIGLGLHESYDIIVNKYKGDLILENDFQSSTDFIIRLPLKA
ncbi:MAG: sensor histidine kinase, partial [Bacteroidota bacterium]